MVQSILLIIVIAFTSNYIITRFSLNQHNILLMGIATLLFIYMFYETTHVSYFGGFEFLLAYGICIGAGFKDIVVSREDEESF